MISDTEKRLYFDYFNLEIRDQDKATLEERRQKMFNVLEYLWFGDNRKITMITVICYFCMVNIVGINKNNSHKWQYHISLATSALPHSETRAVLVFQDIEQTGKNNSPISDVSGNECYHVTSNPKLFLNVLIIDSDLSNEWA